MRPVIAVDPGRMSGVACVVPCKGGSGRLYLNTRAVRVEAEASGLMAVRNTVMDMAASCLAAGYRMPDIEWVVEIQHVRFAAAALVVTEVRRTWEVYIYEASQVLPDRVHPSEWRSVYGLNTREAGKKKDAAREVLDRLVASEKAQVFEAIAAPKRRRTSDEVEAALMALSRMGVW